MSFLLKSYSFVEVVHLSIRCNKTKFFLLNTKNTHGNGVNKQKTHTKHSEKDKIGKGRGEGGGGGVQLLNVRLLNFFFLTVQENQVMTPTLF